MEGTKRAFPLWEIKMPMVEPLWEADKHISKWRSTHNPRYWAKFKASCIDAWIKIRAYRDILGDDDDSKIAMAQLEESTINIPSRTPAEWDKIHKFLVDAFKKLGLTDIGKREIEEEDPLAGWDE